VAAPATTVMRGKAGAQHAGAHRAHPDDREPAPEAGQAYSPGASSEPSRIWKTYGTFSITASVDVGCGGHPRRHPRHAGRDDRHSALG
jgi:hypothetical protein